MVQQSPAPGDTEREDFLLSCRYGELEEVKEFVEKYGPDGISAIRDANGNSVVHMAAGNGHDDVLDYLSPLIPLELLSSPNHALSTPLHWAALNSHMSAVQKIVKSAGAELIDLKNASGRTPLGEAEMAGWDEGAAWMVSVMNLKSTSTKESEEDAEIDGTIEDGSHIDVQIEDADGGVARMTLDRNDIPATNSASNSPTMP